MQGTPTTMVYLNDAANNNQADDSDELTEFIENVAAGDYITFVYQTPSNAGSWHRAGGTIKNIRTLHGRFDDLHFEIKDSDREQAGDTGYFHLHERSGQYYFSDNNDSEQDWGIKKIAWTPEN